MVDSIDGNTYVFEPQQGGDENNLARGAWDWNFDWKRIPLNAREKVFEILKKFWITIFKIFQRRLSKFFCLLFSRNSGNI